MKLRTYLEEMQGDVEDLMLAIIGRIQDQVIDTRISGIPRSPHLISFKLNDVDVDIHLKRFLGVAIFSKDCRDEPLIHCATRIVETMNIVSSWIDRYAKLVPRKVSISTIIAMENEDELSRILKALEKLCIAFEKRDEHNLENIVVKSYRGVPRMRSDATLLVSVIERRSVAVMCLTFEKELESFRDLRLQLAEIVGALRALIDYVHDACSGSVP